MQTAAPTTDELKSRIERAQLVIEAHHLEKQAALIETAASVVGGHPRRLIESHGDLVDRREFLNDTPGWYGATDGRYANIDDRANGAERPFLETEQDFLEQLGIGRHIAKTDGIAIGALENLKNYVVGTGFSYKFTLKPREQAKAMAKQSKKLAKQKEIEQAEKKQAGADFGFGQPEEEPAPQPLPTDPLCEILQEQLEEIQEANCWPLLEREIFECSRRDGERLVVPVWGRNGQIRLKVELPEFITEPRDIRGVEEYIGEVGLDWKFGVATIPNDPANVVGFFVQRYGDIADWDFIYADKCQFIKLNSDSDVKRGFGDFYAVDESLDLSGKLLNSTTIGSKIQSDISLVRRHDPGTSGASIDAFITGAATASVNLPTANGTQQRSVKKSIPGTILDVTATEFEPGVLGQSQSPRHIETVQANYRKIGCRWAMTEYIISGDASNNAYASTLSAGAPFTKAAQAMQAFYCHHYRELMWKALALKNEKEQFCEDIQEVRKRIWLEVTPGNVEVRDRTKENEMYKSLQDDGIISPRTRAEKLDFDFDAEIAKGAKVKKDPKLDLLKQAAQDQLLDKKPEQEKKANPDQHGLQESRIDQFAKGLWPDYPGGRPLIESGSSDKEKTCFQGGLG
jgi:hypothetical protein